jgi:hypothetical protein
LRSSCCEAWSNGGANWRCSRRWASALARVTRLVLGENAFLLVLGLLVGTGCAVLGVLPTLFASERTVNVTALALTLAAVLAIGLTGLALAVWLGQRQISPADLRAE